MRMWGKWKISSNCGNKHGYVRSSKICALMGTNIKGLHRLSVLTSINAYLLPLVQSPNTSATHFVIVVFTNKAVFLLCD